MKLRSPLLVAITAFLANGPFVPSVFAAALPLEQMGVPLDDSWLPLPLDVVQELRALLAAGPDELERLLSSDDPREVGLGLFVLDQSGDLGRLIALVDLLDDDRLTVPCAGRTVTRGHYIPQPQTIGEYLAHIYSMWFWIPSREAAARKDEIRNLQDPWARPRPWIQKIQRALQAGRNRHSDFASRAPLVADVKAEIAALPSDIRWAIITEGRSEGFYTPAEARAGILAVDQSVREQIMIGDPLAAKAGQIGWNLDEDLVLKARELLDGP